MKVGYQENQPGDQRVGTFSPTLQPPLLCLPASIEDYIYIRIQQRNGRKTLTTVKGLLMIMIKRNQFACSGTAIEQPEYGGVIQLQGDQHKNTCQFFIETGQHDQMKVHGF